jgi:aryl-alcohol dehydrogenase-like predicted oxidoreductase
MVSGVTTSDAAAAGTWTLGDLTVNRMGFGAMRLTGTAAFHGGTPRDRDTSIAVLRRAVELGVNHIDTAAFYFSSLRSANELINSALHPYTDDLVIVTKVGPGRDPSGEWMPAARPDQLRGQVEENLRQLGRDHLDVVNLRSQGPGSIAEQFGALSDLRTRGLIRHLGVSAIGLDQLNEARAIAPVVCVQNPYGLGFRAESDDLVRACGADGIAFVPFFSLAGPGRESGAATEDAEPVRAVAAEYGVSPAQIRLAWTLHRGDHMLAIPGTGDLGHLADNIAAAGLRLSEDDLARLEAVHHPG